MPGTDKQGELLFMAREWLQQKRALLEEKKAQIDKLSEECEMLYREIKPLEDWVNTMDGKPGKQVESPDEIDTVMSIARGSGQEQGLRGDHLREEVVKVLKEADTEELYYREILERLYSKGFEVGGKNPGLNLVAHLSKEPRVEKTGKRGVYRLKKD